MSFGSRSSPPPPPSYQAPPPPPEMLDVIDKINGVQMIKVKGANGKDQWVREQLPLTPEQQAMKKFGGELLDKSLGELIQLNQYDPSQTVDFASYLNAMATVSQERAQDMAKLSNLPDFKAYADELSKINSENVEKQFDSTKNQQREYLESRGYGVGSTAYADMERGLATAKADALRNAKRAAVEESDLSMARTLANRQNAFDLKEKERFGRLQEAEQEHNLRLQQQQILDQRRQQAMQNQMNLFQVGSELEGSDYKKTLVSRAPELALDYHKHNSADNLARYTAGVQAQNAAYQNQMAHYNASKPGTSFLDGALNVVGTAGSIWLGNQASNPSPAPAFNSKGIKQVPVNQVGVLRNGY